MAGDIDNPRIWAGADAYTGPLDATAPTDAETPLSGDFEALGLLGEDGMEETRDQDTTDHYAWGGKLVRTTRSKHKRSFKLTALEDNPVVYALVNPGSEEETAGGVTTRTVKVPESDRRSFVVELLDGDVIKRRYIPTGEVIEVGPVKSSDSEMQMYELTINVYPDADGVLYLDFTNDPQAETGS